MSKKLDDKQFRRAFVESNVRRGLAYQVRAMRKAKKLSQGEVGALIGKPQNVVSRLENPSYGKWTVQTLLEVAAGFDVAVIVKFVPYSRLVRDTNDLSPELLTPKDYVTEQKEASSHWTYSDSPTPPVTVDGGDLDIFIPARSNALPDIAIHPYATGD